MEYVLLVSWMFGVQTSSYQVEFGSRELCDAAREELVIEEARIAMERAKVSELRSTSGQVIGTVGPGVAPILSAICAKRK